MIREMVNSGIPWIGDIPKEWKVCQVKNLFTISRGRVIPITDMDDSFKYPVYSSQTKDNGCMGYISTFDYKEEALTWTTDGANAGTVFYRNGKFNCTNVCGVLQLKDKCSFIKYMLYSVGLSAFNSRRADTNGYKIMSNEMAEIQIIVPHLVEQQKIASFLDKKCAEIEEMITLQEKIIEELKAYKQSVITEAVTKGLNPNVPMKESGIEWIGQIPAHWEVKRMKFIGKADNGLTYTPNDVCEESEGTLVIRSSNIQNGKLVYDDNVYVRSVPVLLKVQKGDIIICSRNGSASLVGKSALVDCDIDASFGAFMMRFRSEYNCKYIHFLLTATITHYKQLFTTTTINQLTMGLLNNIAMPFINNSIEQQSIADYLDTKCTEIDNLISIKQQKIEHLKEYKKSIIYEYVTGKKEVEE